MRVLLSIVVSLFVIAGPVFATPSFNPPPGVYPEETDGILEVSISTTNTGAQIYYTTDGSRPVCYDAATQLVWSATVQEYQGSLTAENGRDSGENALSHIMTAGNEEDMYDPWYLPAEDPRKIPVIRAVEVVDGVPGEIVSASYLLGDMATRYGDVPIFSICAEWADLFDNVNGPGIYRYPTAADKAKVKNSHIEFFDRGARQFSKWIELRIQGTSTLTRPKKSLRLTGWKGYNAVSGKKEAFNYKFFEDKDNTKYSTVVLRMGGNDWNQGIIRDQLAQAINKHGKVDVQYGRACVVFLNGVYWGVHEIRERWESGYFKYQQGVDDSDYFTLLEYGDGKVYPLVDQGLGEDDAEQTSQAYSNFWGILRQLETYNDNLEDPERYAWFTNVIEPDSLMQHFGASMFANNVDWPMNNQRWWRTWPDETGEIVDATNPRNDGRWNWTFHDMDFAFTLPFSYVPDFNTELFSAYNAYPHIVQSEGVPYVGTFLPDSARAFNSGLSNTNFLHRYLNYLYLQFATAWRPDVTTAVLEQTADRFRAAGMDENGLRWRMPASAGAYEQKLDAIRNYLTGRPAAFAWHTRKRFNLEANQTLVLNTGGGGEGDVAIAGFVVNSNTLPGVGALPLSVPFPANIPVTLEARPAAGSLFDGWYETTADRPVPLPMASAADCAANYGDGEFPASNRGSGWSAWALTADGGDAGGYVGNSDMPIHGRSVGGTSFGLYAHSGQNVELRRELADGGTLAEGQTMSLDIGFGVAGDNGGAGVAFIATSDGSRPVELILARGDAAGESFRLILGGQSYQLENFPHIVGAPIHVALQRTSAMVYALYLERAGTTFMATLTNATPIAGVRFYKNAYGDSQDKYNLFFDNLRVAEDAFATGSELARAERGAVMFYEPCKVLDAFQLSVENATGGSFVSDQPLVNIGLPCIGLWANGDAFSKASRLFGFALTNGHTLSWRMQNGFIDNNAGVGVDLLDANGTALLFIGMNGGESTYRIGDTATTVPYTTTGLDAVVDVLNDAGTRVRVTLGGVDCGTFDLAAPIVGLCFLNGHAGNGTVYNFYFNEVVVTGPAGAPLPPPEPEETVLFNESGATLANTTLWNAAINTGDAGWAGTFQDTGNESASELQPNALGLYSGGGGSVLVTRDLKAAGVAFTNEYVLSFRFQNGEVAETGSSVGWQLRDKDNVLLCGVVLSNGSLNYTLLKQTFQLESEDTGLAATTAAQEVRVAFQSPTEVTLSMGSFSTNLELVGIPTQLQVFNRSAGADSPRNVYFNHVKVTGPAPRASGTARVAARAVPRLAETLLSTDPVYAVDLTAGDRSIVAKFTPKPKSDYEQWAEAHSVTNLWADDATNGMSYAEAYLRETNDIPVLHGVTTNGRYGVYFTPGAHGVDSVVEVTESLLPVDWREPRGAELTETETGVYDVAPTNAAGSLYIRLKLRPLN